MRRILSVLAAGTIALSACSDDTVGPSAVYDFVVVPEQAELALTQDDSVLMSAMVVDTVSGSHMLSPQLTWTSDDPNVAIVEGAGDGEWRIRATGGGETEIHAVFEAAKGSTDGIIHVSVEANPADVFTIDETAVTLYPGDTTTLGITLQDADGDDLSHRRIDWENSADSVASVDLDGFVSALSLGTTTVTATVEGTEHTVVVTVAPRPVDAVIITPDLVALHMNETVTLTASLKAANGESLDDRDILWATSDTTVATVDEDGVVTAVGPGIATIVATSEGKFASATIFVDN